MGGPSAATQPAPSFCGMSEEAEKPSTRELKQAAFQQTADLLDSMLRRRRKLATRRQRVFALSGSQGRTVNDRTRLTVKRLAGNGVSYPLCVNMRLNTAITHREEVADHVCSVD
jgi:hypothetical protein